MIQNYFFAISESGFGEEARMESREAHASLFLPSEFPSKEEETQKVRALGHAADAMFERSMMMTSWWKHVE